MFLFFFVLFIAIPVIEIAVIVQVSHLIGGWNAIGLLLLISFVGAWLMRHEGFLVLRRIREQVDAGRVPGNELIDGFLALVGGLMMLTPGFVTDAFGLLLVFPPTRLGVRTLVAKRYGSSFGFVNRFPQTRRGRGGYPDDDVIDV